MVIMHWPIPLPLRSFLFRHRFIKDGTQPHERGSSEHEQEFARDRAIRPLLLILLLLPTGGALAPRMRAVIVCKPGLVREARVPHLA